MGLTVRVVFCSVSSLPILVTTMREDSSAHALQDMQGNTTPGSLGHREKKGVRSEVVLRYNWA